MEPVKVSFTWPLQLPDPNDEMVLEADVNGQADTLLAHNLDDFTAAGARFGLVLLRPGELLERIKAMSNATYPSSCQPR